MASISGSVTVAGDPDDWIACAFDADTHAFAGVAAVSGGTYSITGLTAGRAYVVACRPKTGGVWQAEYPLYGVGSYCVPTDPVTTPYIFEATESTPGDEYYANVVLLLPMDGADDGTTFTDATGKTVSNPGSYYKTKTGTKKYGTASAKNTAQQGYLSVPASPDFLFDEEQDWTFECWIYWPSISTEAFPTIFDNRNTSSSTALRVYLTHSDSKARMLQNNSAVAISSALTRDAWVHLALVRYGGSVKFYVDGASGGTEWNSPGSSIGSSSNTNYIGQGYYPDAQGSASWLDGYIDDLRITKGLARYTADFTPPASAHPEYAGLPSGSTEPTWPTSTDATVVDGGVTWTNRGQMVRPLMHGPLIAA